jgi:hypothetical protein
MIPDLAGRLIAGTAGMITQEANVFLQALQQNS